MASPTSSSNFSAERGGYSLPYRTNSDLAYTIKRSNSKDSLSSQKALIERLGKSAHVGLSALRSTIALAPWDEDPVLLNANLKKMALTQVASIRSQATSAKQQLEAFIETVLNHCDQLEQQFREQSSVPSLRKSETLESHAETEEDLYISRGGKDSEPNPSTGEEDTASEQSWDENGVDIETDGNEESTRYSVIVSRSEFSVAGEKEEEQEHSDKCESEETTDLYTTSRTEEFTKKKSFKFSIWKQKKSGEPSSPEETSPHPKMDKQTEVIGAQSEWNGAKAKPGSREKLSITPPSDTPLARAPKVKPSALSPPQRRAEASGSDSEPPRPSKSAVLPPVEEKVEQRDAALTRMWEAAEKEKWGCPICTLQNEFWVKKCAACDNPKPGLPGHRLVPPETTQRVGMSPRERYARARGTRARRMMEKRLASEMALSSRPDWTCGVCTLKNSARIGKCAACGFVKGAAANAVLSPPSAGGGGEFGGSEEGGTEGSLLSPRRIVRMSSNASEGAYGFAAPYFMEELSHGVDGESSTMGELREKLMRTSSEPVDTAVYGNWAGRFGDPLYRAASIPEESELEGRELGVLAEQTEANWASPDRILSPVDEKKEVKFGVLGDSGPQEAIDEGKLFKVIAKQFEEVQKMAKKQVET